MTEYDDVSVVDALNVVDIGDCGGMSGNSGLFCRSSELVTSSMRSTSSATAGCRFAVGLLIFVRSLPRLLLLPRRKESFLSRFGRGETGWSRNSGGISLRQGLGSAIACERIVAASRVIGICDILSECRLGF